MEIRPRRICWPTDFSELSLHGGRYALALSAQFGAELHVIHIVPPPFSPDVFLVVPAEAPVPYPEPELVAASQEALERLVAEQFGGCDRLVIRVLTGNPWPTICRYARDDEIDLLVVTTHGRTGLSHVLIGSTAERIVQHAPCPVLVVKHPAKDFLTDRAPPSQREY